MSPRLTLGILIALVVAHFALAATYASITPYRQPGALLGLGLARKIGDIGAPDERQHVNYVIHLLDGKGFPVFSPTDPHLGEDYQSHQPPAYYLLEAAWCKVTGVSDLTDRGNGLRIRLLNAFIGAGTVAGTFFLALWGLRRPEVALTAASFVAFLPMFTGLSGAVSNDPLLILLCTWILALTARCLRDGWSWKQVVLIGVLTGVALLTKTTALALAPVLLLAGFLGRRFPAQDKSDGAEETGNALGITSSPSMAMVAAAAGLALVVVSPWWIRNQELYHDPLAIGAFNKAFTLSAQKSDMIAMIEALDPGGSSGVTYWKDYIGWWTARSFFGVFGYMDIWMNERGTSFTGVSQKGPAPNTLYRFLLAGTVLCVLGWILAVSNPEWKDTRSVQIVNASFCVIVLLLFIRFNMQYFQAQARYLFPALGPIACGMAIGAAQLLSKRRQLALPIIAVVFLGVNLYAISILPQAFTDRIEAAKRLPG